METSVWTERWQEGLTRVQRELTLLDADQRLWLRQRLTEVVRLKEELQGLFELAQGPEACAACDGACCAKGQHHMTLVEVLTALILDYPLPEPLPDATCPFLGVRGCLLEPALRPFNCVTFNCEQVEGQLSDAQQESFYRLEGELRALYSEFEERFAAASLRGLVIRLERLGPAPLLAPPPERGQA